MEVDAVSMFERRLGLYEVFARDYCGVGYRFSRYDLDSGANDTAVADLAVGHNVGLCAKQVVRSYPLGFDFRASFKHVEVADVHLLVGRFVHNLDALRENVLGPYDYRAAVAYARATGPYYCLISNHNLAF